MELYREREPQDLINGSNEVKAVLSEDALRQLSKSLIRLIPNSHVNCLEEGSFMYGIRRRPRENY